MRMALALLLAASPAIAQVTARDVVMRDVSITTAAGGVCSIPDETDTFLAVWRMEEATSATRTNSSATGSNNNMLNSGSVEQDGVNYIEGTYSAHFTEADPDHLYCNKATCTDVVFSGSVSVLGWFRKDNDTEHFTLWDSSNTYTGLVARALIGNNDCKVGDGADWGNTASGSADPTLETWYHYACVHDATASTVQNYLNGKTDGSSATQQSMVASTKTYQEMGRTSSIYLDGNLDEWAIVDQALSPEELCHICSCQIDGSLCSCSGGVYSDLGRNATYCQSCDLPADPEDPIQ